MCVCVCFFSVRSFIVSCYNMGSGCILLPVDAASQHKMYDLNMCTHEWQPNSQTSWKSVREMPTFKNELHLRARVCVWFLEAVLLRVHFTLVHFQSFTIRWQIVNHCHFMEKSLIATQLCRIAFTNGGALCAYEIWLSSNRKYEC